MRLAPLYSVTTNHRLKESTQIGVLIARVPRVKREDGHGMLAGELAKDLVAADFAAGIGRHQAACFDPENPHCVPVYAALAAG